MWSVEHCEQCLFQPNSDGRMKCKVYRDDSTLICWEISYICRQGSRKTSEWNKKVKNIVNHVKGLKHIDRVIAYQQRRQKINLSFRMRTGFTLVTLAYQGIKFGDSYKLNV